MTTAARTAALLPLRTGVVLPGSILTIPVGRKKSRALVEALDGSQQPLIVGTQRDPKETDPGLDDVHPIATLARVIRVARSEHGYLLVVRGERRARLDAFETADPYWQVTFTAIDAPAPEAEAEARELATSLADELRVLDPEADGAIGKVLREVDPALLPGRFADRVAAAVGLSYDKDLEVLTAVDVPERLRLVTRLIGEAMVTSDVRKRIDDQVRRELHGRQREAVLRQQLAAIQRELGDEGAEGVVEKLRARLDAAELSDEAREVADRELRRLDGMAEGQAEYNVVRTYLEWLADLPWSSAPDAAAAEAIDLDRATDALEAAHYGLDDVKRRILEHLAVIKLSGNPRGSVLCLAGPPGVGKTSLARSVAEALGRPMVRIALGGVRDEAEIRGHRRTYVGALPGRILQALKKAAVKNPVFLLDEVDKLGRGWQGSPEDALLEVLDPEQNATFADHYLEVPFDLSQVFFICTANDIGNLSAPLRDRLEIVELSGYTEAEKLHIARRHLLPRQLADHGIDEGLLTLDDDALQTIIGGYTREAGVRQLDRQLAKLCRGLALQVAREGGSPAPRVIGPDDLPDTLGRRRFFSEVAERTALPGVATGLAWTPAGGDILFVETSRMHGGGRLEITGQLGDVMKESARAALTFVRSNAETLAVTPEFLEKQDLHIHVPAGAVPKDGPSAGVTIFTALTSLLTGRRVRPDTAMTGECTLRGRVLPVGGIKAKVLAAHRAGIERVILPARNERDLDEVPAGVLDDLEVHFVEDMSEVLALALEPTPDLASGGDFRGDGEHLPSAPAA